MTTEDILIDRAQLSTRMEENQPLTFIDIRPHKEFEEYSIPGSLHVAVYEKLKSGDRDAFANISLPKNNLLITVCGGGKLSITAVEKLIEKGYKAYSLKGGLKAWFSE